MRTLIICVFRGALCFGVANAVLIAIVERWPASAVANIAGPLVCGAAAGAALTYGTEESPRTATAFGCGYAIFWLVVVFSMISIQGGGRPEFGWGGLAGAIGFGLAGAIGGASIRFSLLLQGALVFGAAGALGGYFAFHAIDQGSGLAGLALAWGLSGALAGGLFGAAVAASARRG